MATKKTTKPATETVNAVEEVKTATVIPVNGLNLRSGKSLDSDIVEILPEGTVVSIEGKISNGWQKVITSEDTMGYVVAEYLAY